MKKDNLKNQGEQKMIETKIASTGKLLNETNTKGLNLFQTLFRFESEKEIRFR